MTVTGDYYTRINQFANNDLFRQVEGLGGVIFTPPTLVDTIPLYLAKEIEKYRKRAAYWKLIQFLLLNLELRYQEHKVRNIFEHDILNNFEMKPKDILEKTSKYLNKEISTGIISPVGNVIDTQADYPETVVASALWHFEPTLDTAIGKVRDGSFKADDYGVYSFMKEGGCSLAPLGTFEGKIPEDAMKLVAEREAAIKDGSFTVEINDDEPKST